MAHAWETWSDARAYDGTATILQPQALPLYDGISIHTMVALFSDPSPDAALDPSKRRGRTKITAISRSRGMTRWRTASFPIPPVQRQPWHLRTEAASLTPSAPPDHPLTILFRPDPSLWDGRFANNPWLQELPRPLTKLTWDNPLLLSPQKARQLKARNGDKVRLSMGKAAMTVPVWIVPGQAPDCVVALMGFGRRQVGAVGANAEFDF